MPLGWGRNILHSPRAQDCLSPALLVDEITMQSRNMLQRLNITSAISFALVERKVPSRKDKRRSGARRYFEFITFLNDENLSYELSDLAGDVIDGIFYEQELARVEKNLQEEELVGYRWEFWTRSSEGGAERRGLARRGGYNITGEGRDIQGEGAWRNAGWRGSRRCDVYYMNM